MPEENIELVCNCKDEFKTGPCPVHYSQEAAEKYNNRVFITDEHLVPEEIRQWAGYAYKCPRCGQDSILDMMNYCGNCGVEITIQSRKLTDFINKLMEKNKELVEGV